MPDASRNGRRAVALIVALAMAVAAQAKGAFQAEGTISHIETRADAVSLRFAGKVSLGYAAGSPSDSTTPWKELNVTTSGVTLTIRNWTRRHKPDQKADPAEIDREIGRVHKELTDFAVPGRPLRLSIDNPELTFSNDGQLVGVSGTYIYTAPPYK